MSDPQRAPGYLPEDDLDFDEFALEFDEFALEGDEDADLDLFDVGAETPPPVVEAEPDVEALMVAPAPVLVEPEAPQAPPEQEALASAPDSEAIQAFMLAPRELELTEADWLAYAELFGMEAATLARAVDNLPPLAAPEPEVVARPEIAEEARKQLEARRLEHGAESPLILRFTRSERLLHWAIAGPFLVCYLSALVLWLFYTDQRPPLRALVSWIHRISGVLMIALPALVAMTHWREYRVHLENIKEAWIWTRRDIKWLFLMGPATFDKKIELPDQDKFNAAEKINFMNVMVTYPLYIVTGVLIWLPGVAFWPWAVHVLMAAMATPLLGGHIFMAVCNPETRVGLSGMITGLVDRHWAKHHYRDWYRRKFEAPSAPAVTGGEKQGPSPKRRQVARSGAAQRSRR